MKRFLEQIWLISLVLAIVLVPICNAQSASRLTSRISSSQRLNYHTAPDWTIPLMKDQHRYTIPSLTVSNDGSELAGPEDWFENRRPELVRRWTEILGKLSPTKKDAKWFGDIGKVVVHDTQEKDGYTRIHLSLPIEKDFLQPHLLLLPKDQGPGPFPAVIAWTSTSPDYKKPEEWWGQWLARRGYVVLTSWSFIRHYREGTSYSNRVNERVYKRFGHWLPMAKMVHDVQREVEFLTKRPEVDENRLGFMGFSLSAKSALYVAAFAPEIKATVAIDPHVAMHGDTNYHDEWYLDWKRRFDSIHTDDYPDPELRGTIWSLLDSDPSRPGFERNHHELMALCAPRALLLIGCSMDKTRSSHSDNLQSWGYFNRAKEVYDLLDIPERLEFATTDEGHRATSPRIDPAWQEFFERWLKETRIGERTSDRSVGISNTGSSKQDLFFREDFKEVPPEIPVAQKHLSNPDLILHRLGPGEGQIKKSFHINTPNDPHYVWSGLCEGNWAVVLEHKTARVDLNVEGAKIVWRTKQADDRILYLVIKSEQDWLISDLGTAVTKDWEVNELRIRQCTWHLFDPETIERGKRITSPDLSTVSTIGFTDLLPGGGSRACSRLDWVEVYGRFSRDGQNR